MNCDCSACQALDAAYGADPVLLRIYRKKLLIRGWAGLTTPIEKAYILAHAEWARGAAERGRERFARMHAARLEVHAETLPESEKDQNPILTKTGLLIGGLTC